MTIQPTFFDGPKPRPNPEGERRKQEGIDRVLENAASHWKAVAASEILALAQTGEPFTIDALKAKVRPVAGEPHHYNAWGGVVNRAARRKLIRMTGRLVASAQATCHAHKNPEWEGTDNATE